MKIQYKTLPAGTMGIDGRTVTGVFAVHGNVDSGGDRGHPGLFGDGTVGGRKRAAFLWQHDAQQPPTATIDRIFEVARADLPPAVLSYAPEATGGVAVTRTYLETPRAEEILAGLKAGAISEMSYAYEVKQYDLEEGTDARFPVVRNIYKADLYDVSDVVWGMNPATSADGRKGRPLADHQEGALAALSGLIDRYKDLRELRAKEGRVLSGETRKRIGSAVEALDAAQAALRELLDATDPEKGAREILAVYAEYQRLEAALHGALTPC